MILSRDRSQIVAPRQEYICHHDPAAAMAAGLPWGRFCTFCQALFSAWHVLRAVYGQQIISPLDFSAKLRAMILEMVEFFQQNGSDACVNEIAGFLLTVLDEDFFTTVEDDSDWFVAQWLLEGFRRMVDGDFTLLDELAAAGLPLLPGCPDLDSQQGELFQGPGDQQYVLAGPQQPSVPPDPSQYLPQGKYTEQVVGPDGRLLAAAGERQDSLPASGVPCPGPCGDFAESVDDDDRPSPEPEEDDDVSGPSDDYWV